MQRDEEFQREIDALHSALRRSKDARLSAEKLLEQKSAELYEVNQQLLDQQGQLEVKIEERTRDLNEKVLQLEEIQRDLRFERDRARAESEGKTTAFAKLSHEIRTPLNGILGTLNLLSDTDLSPEQFDILALTLSSSEILRLVLNDAIDLAKLEQGAMELELAEFDLGQWLMDLCDFWSGSALLNEQTISADVKTDLKHKVVADSGHLQQIMNNLLSNSIKYADPGEIVITADIRRGQDKSAVLSLSVTDRGKVIPAEERKILFDIYKRSKSEGNNAVGGGAGLGLTISLELAELMGGKLMCAPAPDGLGNMFTLAVPIELGSEIHVKKFKQTSIEKAISIKVSDTSSKRRLRALIVEDVPTNQLILERYMKALNFRVDLADNGREGLEAVKQRPYDLILMDIAMPVMDGYQATQAIKALGGDRAEIPIIAVSAHVASDERTRASEAGLYTFLEKPIDRGNLEYVIAELFERKSSDLVSETSKEVLNKDDEGGEGEIEDEFEAIMLQFNRDFAECVSLALNAMDAGDQSETLAQMHKLSGLSGSFSHARASEIRQVYIMLEKSYDQDVLTQSRQLLEEL
jgi:signal transduction histidine kinase/DNA-binding response OmpR family regulator